MERNQRCPTSSQPPPQTHSQQYIYIPYHSRAYFRPISSSVRYRMCSQGVWGGGPTMDARSSIALHPQIHLILPIHPTPKNPFDSSYLMMFFYNPNTIPPHPPLPDVFCLQSQQQHPPLYLTFSVFSPSSSAPPTTTRRTWRAGYWGKTRRGTLRTSWSTARRQRQRQRCRQAPRSGYWGRALGGLPRPPAVAAAAAGSPEAEGRAGALFDAAVVPPRFRACVCVVGLVVAWGVCVLWLW